MTNDSKIYTGITLDFETGGRDCITCACTELAMTSIRLDTMAVIDTYCKYITPYYKKELGGKAKAKTLRRKSESLESEGELMLYEKDALTYTAITMEMLYDQGVDLKEVASDVIHFAKQSTLSTSRACKPVIIGQNPTFDIGFLQQLMNYGGMLKEFEKTFSGTFDFYGNFQPKYMDTIDLARLAYAHDPDMLSYNLGAICEKFEIELSDAHDAMADVTATTNVLISCADRLRAGTDSSHSGLITTEKTRKYFKI